MAKPILLLDDEEKFAQMLQELLAGCGFEADYCLNPEDALVRLKEENYDLVITDYKMPQMDGSQFLQQARKINPDLPVIMISGLMNMPELIKVANIGVTLVLEKPFNTEDLMDYVARFVRRAGANPADAMAMDMEASEISFQQENVTVTYPAPAAILADASNENKRFLESLWKAANTCRHLPFFAQRGAEVRLVAMEVMGWAGNEPDAEVVRIDLADTNTDITKNWVLETETFPGAFLIDMRDGAWNEAARMRLLEWVDFIETCGKDLSLTRILYVLPTGSRFVVEDLELPTRYRPLFATECPVLLSLRERLLDTAVYIGRLLEERHKALLGRDGLARLLHYSWPGGYKELAERLQVVKSRLDAAGRLTDEQLREILADGSDDASSLQGGLDLVSYLKRRQREYILLHRESGEELKDTILRLGIDSPAVNVDDVLNDRELAFPGVLETAQ